jgi:hypothetical protein
MPNVRNGSKADIQLDAIPVASEGANGAVPCCGRVAWSRGEQSANGGNPRFSLVTLQHVFQRSRNIGPPKWQYINRKKVDARKDSNLD